jgi:flagellar motor switch protein FliG
MDGVRKTAILLQSLDRTLVARVLAMLPRDQAEIAMRISANIQPVTDGELNSALREFKSRLHSRPVAPAIASELPRDVNPRVHDEPDDVVPQAFHPVAASDRDVPQSVASSQQQDAGQADSAPGPFDFLNKRHADDIRQLIQDEQPQTIAVIAAQLSPTLSAAVLAGLSPDRQAEILQRVARLGPTDPEILADIAAVLKGRLGRSRVRSGGVSQASAVLRRSSRAATRSMLANLDEHDSDLADELRQTLFSFDDLLKLDDDTLRVILQETDDRQWALALKASPEAVRKKVLACLSPHLAQAFKNEMDSLGPVRLSEMTSVRQQIADSIHRLESSGLITLPID